MPVAARRKKFQLFAIDFILQTYVLIFYGVQFKILKFNVEYVILKPAADPKNYLKN